ncbi:ribonuclease III [Candidatus Dojkabacteria bacterium]|uniref:Ribonuclease 3 n=1 Tax=Candidatus Dojkabacteria bacterium TaxID=2099670 RepID=A0A3M0Z3V4_9BACT|nr:MAG: ribonuclease III [Candidatus Dojkabacteria bacterium]
MTNQDRVNKLMEIVGLSLDMELAIQALTHKSVKTKSPHIVDNERLEFLGDAVLELIVTKHLYNKFPNHSEGELTIFRSALVKTESLAFESCRLGFDNLIIMSEGEVRSGGRQNKYILADFFESVLGAVYLSSNFEFAEAFVIKNLLYKLDEIITSNSHKNPKTVVQEYLQAKFKVTPEYKELSSEGPDHSKIFVMGLFLRDIFLTSGRGSSKQKAEQVAAMNFLKNKDVYLELIREKL